MMNIFNFFFKPVEMAELVNWPIAEILKFKGQLLDDSKTILLPKDKFARVAELEHIVAERLKWAISCNSHVETTALCVEVDCAGCITVYEKTFNDAVMQFTKENKVFRRPTEWFSSYESNTIDEVLRYRYHFDPHNCNRSISELAKDIVIELGDCHESLDRLKQLIEEYRWAIPVVKHIQVVETYNGERVPTWSVVGFNITPELLDGFMNEAKRILQDDEAVAVWRDDIIHNFSTYAGNDPEKVDFDKPDITVSYPEEWKREYYTRVKPEMERRERSKGVIDEIRRAMPNVAALRDLKLSELVALLPEGATGIGANLRELNYRKLLP
jgi:hypothetical protein